MQLCIHCFRALFRILLQCASTENWFYTLILARVISIETQLQFWLIVLGVLLNQTSSWDWHECIHVELIIIIQIYQVCYKVKFYEFLIFSNAFQEALSKSNVHD